MLGFRRNLKVNKILTNIIKLFIICFFGLVLFDKSNLNTVKDIVVKLDADYIYSFFSKIVIAVKAITFDLPMIISFIIYVINFICVVNSLILISLMVYKIVTLLSTLLFRNHFTIIKHYDDNMVSSIYLLNEKFRC